MRARGRESERIRSASTESGDLSGGTDGRGGEEEEEEEKKKKKVVVVLLERSGLRRSLARYPRVAVINVHVLRRLRDLCTVDGPNHRWRVLIVPDAPAAPAASRR